MNSYLLLGTVNLSFYNSIANDGITSGIPTDFFITEYLLLSTSKNET
jgi:hypothetical protein